MRCIFWVGVFDDIGWLVDLELVLVFVDVFIFVLVIEVVDVGVFEKEGKDWKLMRNFIIWRRKGLYLLLFFIKSVVWIFIV